MKEIKLKLFRFEELKEDVRHKIIEERRWDIADFLMDVYGDEYIATLKKFSEVMDIDVFDWEVGYERYNYRFRFKGRWKMGDHWGMDEDDIKGKYLRRYLNNHVLPYILTPKRYYNFDAGWDNERKRWKVQRYSRIFCNYFEDCPLTGMCYDWYVLKPIKECLSKLIPDDYTLHDLVDDVLHNFFQAWHEEYEYWFENKDGCIDEEVKSRYEDEWFYEDGTLFNGKYEEVA